MESYLISPWKLHKVIDLTGDIRMLDVGGGAGHLTVLAAVNNKKLRGTIFDRPEIIRIARNIIHDYDLERRISLFPGNILQTRWPNGFNTILLSNVLHGKSDLEAEKIFARAAKALDYGGRIFVNESIRGANKASSLLDLTLMLCTREGRLRSRQELSGFALRAGFGHLVWKRLDGAHWLMEGRMADGSFSN